MLSPMRSLWILASMLAACGSSEPTINNDPPRPARASAPEPARNTPVVATKQLVFPPGEPGPAYIVVGDGIVAILPDGTTQQIAGMMKYVERLTIGLDWSGVHGDQQGCEPRPTADRAYVLSTEAV